MENKGGSVTEVFRLKRMKKGTDLEGVGECQKHPS